MQTGWYKAHLGPGGFSIVADFEADSTLDTEIGHEGDGGEWVSGRDHRECEMGRRQFGTAD